MRAAIGILITAMVMCAVVVGCRPRAPAPAATAPAAVSALRIVSLSPALTRSATDLGAGASIVGRTPWCDAPSATVVGTLQDVDLARVREVHPTLLLVQAGTVDPSLQSLAQSIGARLFQCHINSRDDIVKSLEQLAAELETLGATGARTAFVKLREAHERAVEQAKPAVAGAGKTLILFSVDPPTAFGAGTYVDDLWRGMGGANAIEKPGYPELSLEDIVRLDPSRIVVVRSSAAAQLPLLESLPERLRTRVRVVAAPCLLEPSTAFLRDGPAALGSAVSDTAPAPTTAPTPPPQPKEPT